MSPASMRLPSAAPPPLPVSQGINDLSINGSGSLSAAVPSQVPGFDPATNPLIPQQASAVGDQNLTGVDSSQVSVGTGASPAVIDITQDTSLPETDGVIVLSDAGLVSGTFQNNSNFAPTSSTQSSSELSQTDSPLEGVTTSLSSMPLNATGDVAQLDKPSQPDQSVNLLQSSQANPNSQIENSNRSAESPFIEQENAKPEKVTLPKTTTIPVEPKNHYINLLDVLVDQKALTQDEANEIVTESVKKNKPIDQLVEESSRVSEDILAQAKAIFYKVPYVKLADVGIHPEALSLIPESAARLHGVLPFSVNMQDNTLSVAMRNPLDVTTVNFVEQKTGMRVISYFAAQSEIERLIAEHYAQNLSSEVSQAVEQSQELQKKQLDFADLSGKTVREAPVTKIVQTILLYSLKTRASDVHIEPQEDKTRVRYRIDGILQEKLILPKSVHNAVVSRIKILSGLKIDERRLPQDGRFDFTDHDTQVDLRVSTLPTIHGEKVVMRLLKKNAQVPSLEELGLTGLALRNMSDAIKVPHGIILVTGPTGSGKTTTLYSVLHTINSPMVNIVTLEDPVEYMMTGVNQVQVNPQAGLTFASGLRSFLRQDPNVIMVGEIRDSETANLAVQASLTGHLVFATLHTSSAAGAIPRLMDMGAEPFLLASSMTLVVAQRIARVINPEYKETYKPDPAIVKDIEEVLGERFQIWLKEHNLTKDSLVLTRAAEKRPETEPEYKGRIAIFEVMKVTDEIGKLILARKPAADLEDAAIKAGMFLMKQDGYLKVLDGITTIEEVLRVAQI